MPLFICDKCGCIENTALGHFWSKDYGYFGEELRGKALCSECMPTTYSDGSTARKGGAWHGKFEKSFPTEDEIKNGEFINRSGK